MTVMLGISLTGDSRTEVVTTISGNLAKIFSLVYDVSGFQPVGKYFKVVCPLSPNPTLLQKKNPTLGCISNWSITFEEKSQSIVQILNKKTYFWGAAPFVD